MSTAEDGGASAQRRADATPSPSRLSSGLLKIIAIGLVAGLFSSLFGVGGGIVAVPLLMMLVNSRPGEATGTSLAAIAITATVGATLYAIEGEVDFARAALVGIPAVGGVLFGTALQQRIPARNLTFAFAALLVGLGIWMLLGDGTEAAAGSSGDTRTIVAALAAGIAAGILAGLFGVGGGILFVPALVALGLGQLAAEATSLVAVIPTVLVGPTGNTATATSGSRPRASSASRRGRGLRRCPRRARRQRITPAQALRAAPRRNCSAARVAVGQGPQALERQPAPRASQRAGPEALRRPRSRCR